MTIPPPVSETKAALRIRMRRLRDTLDGRAARSAAICTRLIESESYQRAQTIHTYLPIRSEVDSWPIVRHALAAGKRVAVPVVVPDAEQLDHLWLRPDMLDNLVTGAFGTWQPATGEVCYPGECDIVLVPLLAFDRNCRRLGYGKGHYDRVLAGATMPIFGLAFAAQEVASLPNEPHDVALTAIVTEHEVVWPQ